MFYLILEEGDTLTHNVTMQVIQIWCDKTCICHKTALVHLKKDLNLHKKKSVYSKQTSSSINICWRQFENSAGGDLTYWLWPVEEKFLDCKLDLPAYLSGANSIRIVFTGCASYMLKYRSAGSGGYNSNKTDILHRLKHTNIYINYLSTEVKEGQGIQPTQSSVFNVQTRKYQRQSKVHFKSTC